MLFYPKPYSNETLISLLLRMAKEHFMESPKWIFKILEEQTTIKIGENLINWVTDNQLQEISKFLELSSQETYSLTVAKNLDMLGFKVNNKEKNHWFLYSKTRYCPICVSEENYQRKNWINCQTIMCRKHSRFLLDKCTNCKNIININDIIHNKCSKCNTALTDSTSLECNEPFFHFYQEIIDNSILNNSFYYEHEWIKDSQTFLKVLEFLSLWVAKLIDPNNLSIPTIGVIYDGKVLERNHPKNFKSVEQTICLYTYTFNIINNWPSEFYKFLDKAEKKDMEFISFIRNGIPKLLGTHLWDISKELTNYIAKQKALLEGNEYIRSDEIKFYNSKFSGSIIHSNLINSHEVIYKGQQFNLIDKAKFLVFVDKYRNIYTKEDLREYWGTSAKATLSILNSKVLVNSFSYCSGSATPWVIPYDTIQVLNQNLTQYSTQIILNPITFNDTMSWAGPDKASMLLEGMLNKEIMFHFQGKLSETVLDRRSCYYFMKEKILQSSSNTGQIKIRDLVFIFGVKQNDILHWLKTGRFGEVESIKTIPINNFLNFTNLFITTYELAFLLNLKIKQIIKKHSMGKLKSVSGPDLNDGKRLLFFKSELNISLFH